MSAAKIGISAGGSRKEESQQVINELRDLLSQPLSLIDEREEDGASENDDCSVDSYEGSSGGGSYSEDDVLVLMKCYHHVTTSTKEWRDLDHKYVGLRMKMGQLDDSGAVLPFGACVGEIDVEPSYVLNFMMDWNHPFRVEASKNSDLQRFIVSAPNKHTKVFCGVKRMPSPWIPRMSIVKWIHYELRVSSHQLLR